jgi:transposase
MKQITLVGIDLAKSVYHLIGVDAQGVEVVRRRLRRRPLLQWLAKTAPCTVVMEACGGAHHWARVCMRLGHVAKLVAPQFVKPYVKANKNDFADTAAIVEAGRSANMRFVALKDETQQVLQALHRVRSQLIGQRTAISNQLRGLLLEFGVELAKGNAALRQALPRVVEDADNAVPLRLRTLLCERFAAWQGLGETLGQYDRELEQLAKADARCRRLMTVPGIGPLSATGLVAAVSDVSVFAQARGLAAWLGLVPKHVGTGGKVRLLGISKRGDKYLRMLFIHGARSALRAAAQKTDRRSRWVRALAQRRGVNRATVALANKNARTAWAILRYGTEYRAGPMV